MRKQKSIAGKSQKAEKNPIGRPSLYTPEIAEEICARISDGETLASICKDAHMPERTTVFDWVKEDKGGFSQRYQRAREDQCDALADEALTVSKTPMNGVRTVTDSEGKSTVTEEDMLGHRDLIVRTRLKLLPMLSKRYAVKKEEDVKVSLSLSEELQKRLDRAEARRDG